MDVLEIIQRMEITPELTRNIESIKNITGFEQQDLSVWNTNDTNFEVEINDEDTYSNVSKCFLITDGTDWFFVIVSLLDCGAFDYTLIDISDITSIGGDIKDILQTSLTIDVPLSLVYSDDFNITGTLLDENEDAVTGAIIKLFVGSTVVDTKTTNSNGVVSFTQTPVHMGTHSFHLEFAGIDNYLNSQSSTVTRDINKETSVLSLTSPLDNTSVYTDGSLSINGALLTNDAEAISNASVLVKQSDTTIMTLTTGVNGGFSGTINASDLSTGNLSFVYETTSTYTATSQTVAITVASPSLTLTGDKSILSYADEEYCTLTATYLATDNVGKTVSFDIVDGNGDVVENIGTADTNSSGVATCRYDSAGVGDLKVVAKYSTLLSESYGILDCYYAPSIITTNYKTFDNPYYHGNSITVEDNAIKGIGYMLTKGWSNNSNWELSYDAKIGAGSGVILLPLSTTYLSSDTTCLVYDEAVRINGHDTSSYIRDTWHNIKIISNNGLTIKVDDVTIATGSNNLTTSENITLGLYGWATVAVISIKNIKVTML